MPQPVDLQTEIGRLTAVQRIQDIADRASLAAQQRQVTSVEENRVASETQVQNTNQPENREVNADGRRQNPFVGRRRRRKSSGAEDEERPVAAGDEEGRTFDVTI